MKKIVPILLALVLVFSSCLTANATGQNKVLQTVKALGIMVGDTNGNMNLDKNVTRAEYAKMLVTASGTESAADSGTGFNLFTDVSATHWAGQYIYRAVKSGYLVGYTDGTYRPGNNVKLEEVLAGVIKLLGYKASDITGTYPTAYIAKAEDLGLLDNVSTPQGSYVTREDCANIFYNLLLASGANGQTYGTSLGCTVKDGTVTVNVSDDSLEDGIYIGVIQARTEEASDETSTGVSATVTVSCTDGITRSYTVSSVYSSLTTGTLVQATVNNGSATVSVLSNKTLEGTVNAKGTALDTYAFSDDVGIMDMDSYGNSVLVDTEDIAGLTLSDSKVRYYRLNGAGEIETLVLNDATGLLWTNIYLTSASSNSSGMNVTGSYSYLSASGSRSVTTNGKAFGVEAGGAVVKFNTAGQPVSMRNMTEVSVTELTHTTALTKDAKYPVSEDVLVYVRNGSDYYSSDLDTVSGGDFTLTGWISPLTSEKELAILIAVKN